MTSVFRLLSCALVGAVAVAALGCGGNSSPGPSPSAAPTKTGGDKTAPVDEVAAERAKLSPADRALVDAQEWCVVSTDERLGSMGPPLKLDIKGQPVFVCCKGCKRKAESDPDATLAKANELKAKAAAEKAKR
jgi:hypothetical protein